MNGKNNLVGEVKIILEIIEEALNVVEQPYYNILTTYKTEGIIRERVFCYELYHKMRIILEEKRNIEFTLNGEIDKRGHPEFEVEDRKNPDFIFHTPGTMEKNMLIVEVKGKTDGYIEACLKDFETIICFVSKYRYRAGVFILYNACKFPVELRKNVCQKYNELSEDISRNIFILCKEYGSSVRKFSLYDILREG